MHISENAVVVISAVLLSAALILLLRKKIKWGVILGATALLYFDIALPAAKPARLVAQRNACIVNLKQVNGAIEKWSKENNMAAGSKIDVSSVVVHLKNGRMPVCPGGGFYKLTTVGKPSECSLPEHAHTVQ